GVHDPAIRVFQDHAYWSVAHDSVELPSLPVQLHYHPHATEHHRGLTGEHSHQPAGLGWGCARCISGQNSENLAFDGDRTSEQLARSWQARHLRPSPSYAVSLTACSEQD